MTHKPCERNGRRIADQAQTRDLSRLWDGQRELHWSGRARLRPGGPSPVRTVTLTRARPKCGAVRVVPLHSRARHFLALVAAHGGLIILENPASSLLWLDPPSVPGCLRVLRSVRTLLPANSACHCQRPGLCGATMMCFPPPWPTSVSAFHFARLTSPWPLWCLTSPRLTVASASGLMIRDCFRHRRPVPVCHPQLWCWGLWFLLEQGCWSVSATHTPSVACPSLSPNLR